MAESLSFLAEEVRRLDPDRFLAALFAPRAAREDLFALYAFNLELATVREKVSEPLLGEMRLQWWREALETIERGGDVPGHPVAEALARAMGRTKLARATLDSLIDGRRLDFDDSPPGTVAALEDYAEKTSSALMRAALEILDARTPAADRAAREGGIAWAILGLLRAAPHHARQGRLFLPAESLRAAGLDPTSVQRRLDPAAVRGIVADFAARAADHLARARSETDDVPRGALPALLPLALADLYLARLRRADFDVGAPQLHVTKPRRQLRLLMRALQRKF